MKRIFDVLFAMIRSIFGGENTAQTNPDPHAVATDVVEERTGKRKTLRSKSKGAREREAQFKKAMERDFARRKEERNEAKLQRSSVNKVRKAGRRENESVKEKVICTGIKRIDRRFALELNRINIEIRKARKSMQLAWEEVQEYTKSVIKEFYLEISESELVKFIGSEQETISAAEREIADTEVKMAKRASLIERIQKIRFNGDAITKLWLDSGLVGVLMFVIFVLVDSVSLYYIMKTIGMAPVDMLGYIAVASLSTIIFIASSVFGYFISRRSIWGSIFSFLIVASISAWIFLVRADLSITYHVYLSSLNAIMIAVAMVLAVIHFERATYFKLVKEQEADRESLKHLNNTKAKAEGNIQYLMSDRMAAVNYTVDREYSIRAKKYADADANLEKLYADRDAILHTIDSEKQLFVARCEEAYEEGAMRVNSRFRITWPFGWKSATKAALGGLFIAGILSLTGCTSESPDVAVDIYFDHSNSQTKDNVSLQNLETEIRKLTEENQFSTHQVIVRVGGLGEQSLAVMEECTLDVPSPLVRNSDSVEVNTGKFVDCVSQKANAQIAYDSLFREYGTHFYYSIKNSAEYMKKAGVRGQVWAFSDAIEASTEIWFGDILKDDGKTYDDFSGARYDEIVSAFKAVGDLPDLKGIHVRQIYKPTNGNDWLFRNSSRFWERFITECGGTYELSASL